MQVGGVSLDLTLIMHEQAFGDYLTDHSFLSLESVGCGTGYCFVYFTDTDNFSNCVLVRLGWIYKSTLI